MDWTPKRQGTTFPGDWALLKHLIEQLKDRIDLGFAEVREASFLLADPAVPDADKADFLVALRAKGESRKVSQLFARFSFRSESNEKISLVRIRYSRIGQKKRSFPDLCESEVDAIL